LLSQNSIESSIGKLTFSNSSPVSNKRDTTQINFDPADTDDEIDDEFNPFKVKEGY
jgi:hypothetical protein